MTHPELTCSVAVQPLLDRTDPAADRYAFAYTVTVRNTGNVPAQLIARHWVITDARGHVDEVRGLAVVGHQPLLKPGEAFQYTSGARLRTPSGSMQGSYFCVAEDGERFDVQIDAFALDDGASRVLH